MESPMNWIDLPMEMRCECVQWMDFKSRMSLRASSQTEKLIVESSPKIHFDSVKIELDIDFQPSVICKEGTVETLKIEQKTGKKTLEFVQKAYNLVAQLLKFAVIDDLKFWAKFNDDDASEFCSKIFNIAPMKFERLQLEIQHIDVIKMLLTKCEEVEKLVLDGSGFGRESNTIIDKVFDLSALYMAYTLQFKKLSNYMVPYWVILNWMENDADLGTSIQVRFQCPNVLDTIAGRLRNCVVYSSDTELRLTTCNLETHILLRRVAGLGNRENDYYISFMVIPAHLEAEYIENDVLWVIDFKMDDKLRLMRQVELMLTSVSDELDNVKKIVQTISEL